MRNEMPEVMKVLMERDGMTEKEARDALTEMQIRVHEGEDPEEILHEEGLEPDYILDLL